MEASKALTPSCVMDVSSECGPVKTTLLDRKITGRVLIPLDEQARRETVKAGEEYVTGLFGRHINPDEPFRYELPPMAEQEQRGPVVMGHSRTRTVVIRKTYRTWGKR